MKFDAIIDAFIKLQQELEAIKCSEKQVLKSKCVKEFPPSLTQKADLKQEKFDCGEMVLFTHE